MYINNYDFHKSFVSFKISIPILFWKSDKYSMLFLPTDRIIFIHECCFFFLILILTATILARVLQRSGANRKKGEEE